MTRGIRNVIKVPSGYPYRFWMGTWERVRTLTYC